MNSKSDELKHTAVTDHDSTIAVHDGRAWVCVDGMSPEEIEAVRGGRFMAVTPHRFADACALLDERNEEIQRQQARIAELELRLEALQVVDWWTDEHGYTHAIAANGQEVCHYVRQSSASDRCATWSSKVREEGGEAMSMLISQADELRTLAGGLRKLYKNEANLTRVQVAGMATAVEAMYEAADTILSLQERLQRAEDIGECEKLPSLTDAVCIVQRGGMEMHFGFWRCSKCGCENFEGAKHCTNCRRKAVKR